MAKRAGKAGKLQERPARAQRPLFPQTQPQTPPQHNRRTVAAPMLKGIEAMVWRPEDVTRLQGI